MAKILYVLFVGILLISFSGCVTVEKVVRERVDQDISGNQGYIQGASPSPAQAETKTREYIDVKVEVPTLGEIKKNMERRNTQEQAQGRAQSRDRGIAGNKGYIISNRGFEEELPPVYKPTPITETTESPGSYEKAESAETPKTYKVKEGDSLSKISKKVYGKASKWTTIYEANSDKIKDPNKLKTGIVLVIPELKGAEKEQEREGIK